MMSNMSITHQLLRNHSSDQRVQTIIAQTRIGRARGRIFDKVVLASLRTQITPKTILRFSSSLCSSFLTLLHLCPITGKNTLHLFVMLPLTLYSSFLFLHLLTNFPKAISNNQNDEAKKNPETFHYSVSPGC